MKTLLHPADTTGEKNVAFQWFLLVFSFTNACLMWLFFGICCIVSNDRLRGLLRLVVCVLFFFFLIHLCQCLNHRYSMVNAYVHHEVTIFICPFFPSKCFVYSCANLRPWFRLILFTLPCLHAVAGCRVARPGLVCPVVMERDSFSAPIFLANYCWMSSSLQVNITTIKMRRRCHLIFHWNEMEIIYCYLDGRPQAHAWSIRSSGIFYNCMWNCMGIAL